MQLAMVQVKSPGQSKRRVTPLGQVSVPVRLIAKLNASL
jgi:hypothetical protein